jgi:hydrogenase nickel incorporation protein HypB
MCATCGCGVEHEHDDGGAHAHRRGHDHDHAHTHARGHAEEPRRARTLRLARLVLEKNAAHARENRAWLKRRRVTAVNLVSSPGAGKTTLLEATVQALGSKLAISVVVGDQETDRDAERIRAAGGRAVQLNTGVGCHLDAHAVGHALVELDPPPRSVVVVENVGNLVCPALFDLGERAKVVVLSVTEGEDKPLKYPHMFRASELLLLNKMDLLPHLRFDVDRCLGHARTVNPAQQVLRLSATTGGGLEAWCAWIKDQAALVDDR